MIDFVDGVQIFAAGMRGQERGIFGFSGDAEGGEFAGAGVKTVSVDSLAVGLVRVGADENEVGFVGRGLLGRGHASE